MSKLFPSFQSETTKLQPQQARDAIEKYFRKLFTGIVEFSNPDGSGLDLILSRGDIINGYSIKPAGTAITDLEQWHKLITDSPECEMRAFPLNSRTLRYVKIILSQPPVKVITYPGMELESHLDRWLQTPGFQLIHLRWGDAEGLITLAGKGQPVRNCIYLSGKDFIDGAAALPILLGKRGADCEVRWFNGAPINDAWIEYHLHRIFANTVEGLLTRYSELTGQVMVNTAAREFNFQATTNNWNINIIDGKLADNAIFTSPQAAITAYSSLAAIMVRHMQSMIGAGLINLAFREIAGRLDGDAIETLINTEFLPDLMIAGSIKARK